MPRPNAIGKPKPKIEDPMGKLKRLFCYIFKSYGPHCFFACLYYYQRTCQCAGNHVYAVVDR